MMETIYAFDVLFPRLDEKVFSYSCFCRNWSIRGQTLYLHLFLYTILKFGAVQLLVDIFGK